MSEEKNFKKIAEVFTVLISPKPLKELPPLGLDEEPRKIKVGIFESWQKEWKGKTWKFEQETGVGANITKVEKMQV